jgi:hypothetical protein
VQDAVVTGGVNQTKAEVKRERVEAKRNATYEWTRRLVKGVAEANYCTYFCTIGTKRPDGRGRWVKRHAVLGRADNTAVVLVMSDYLYATIMRLIPYDKTTWLSAEALAWCDGVTDRLIERIAAKAEAQRTPDYATQGEQGYCTAIAIRNLAESERIANYDAEYGAGAWAKKVARDAEWEADAPARRARYALEAQQARDAMAARLLAETPADRERRLKAEAKAEKARETWYRRYQAREDAKAARAAAKKSSGAYRTGRAVAETIGLDSQLKHGTRPSGLIN